MLLFVFLYMKYFAKEKKGKKTLKIGWPNFLKKSLYKLIVFQCPVCKGLGKLIFIALKLLM